MDIRAICGDKGIWAPTFFILRWTLCASCSAADSAARRTAKTLEAQELALKYMLRERDFNKGSGPWFLGLIREARLAKFKRRHQRRHL
jgi:hypothetical protein